MNFEGLEFEEVEPLPDEIEIIEESIKAKARGERLYSHEEVWGRIVAKKREKVA